MNHMTWPTDGLLDQDWKLSFADMLPALEGLKDEPGEPGFVDACDAVDRIGEIAAEKLQNGPRTILLKGLPNEWLFNGLADAFYRRICEVLGQLDPDRPWFYDVFDRKLSGRDFVRYADTNLSHGFHTDSTSSENLPRFVGLLCVQQAALGGGSRLVNLYNVCTRISEQSPSTLEILRGKFPRQTASMPSGQVDSSVVDNYPVLWGTIAEGNLRCRYMRRWIDAGYSCIGLKPSPHITAALDAFDHALATEKTMLRFSMEPGDILFIDNSVILHDREAFETSDEAPRLMRRTWVY